jgi:hypothetical protein
MLSNHVVQMGVSVTLGIALVLIVALQAWLSGRKGGHKEALRDLGLLLIIFTILYAIFPWWFAYIVFQGVILHGFGALPAVLGFFMITYGLKVMTGETSLMEAIASLKKSMNPEKGSYQSALSFKDKEPVIPLRSNGLLYALTGLVFLLIGPEAILTLNHSHLAKVYTFEKRLDMIVMSENVPRFTPQEVAFAKLRAALSSSENRIDLEHTQPCDVNGGFGYIATLMPQGFMNIFSEKVPGFLVYDDHPGLAEEQRIHRVHQTFAYGIGMEWTDSIYRRLARYNPFCTYGEPYPLQLSENKDVFTIVVPKISYRLDFPCFWVPYQSGVVLMKDDGTITEKSMTQIKDDPVLRKKRMMCVDLVRLITEKQVYDEGYFRAWYTRPGLIKIPELPGNNKQPFLLTGKDGTEYYVTLTEPVGNQALMRIYYINASTGERTRFDCDPDSPIPGPEVSVQAVKALNGYKWIEHGEDKADGNFHIVEPRIISPNGEMCYLFSVTTKNYFEIVLTCVVEPRSNQLHTFATRTAFEKWMRGEKIPEGQRNQLDAQNLEEAIQLVKNVLQKLEALKTK